MDKLMVLVEQGEDGFFVASCPALKGCWSQGETEAELRPGQCLREVAI